jgi:hypothetical protein
MPQAPTPHYAGYPARSVRRGLIIGIVLAAIILISAVAVGGYEFARGNTHRQSGTVASGLNVPSAAASPTPTPPDSAAPRDHSGDLRRFLMPAPDGSGPWSDPASKDGKLTLRQLAKSYKDETAGRDYLTGLKFQAGAVRTWVEVDGTSVEVDLYRFDSDNHAYTYFNDTVANDVDRPPAGTTINLISKIPHAKGEVVAFTKKNKYGDQLSHGIAVRGDVVLEVWVYQSAPQSVAFTQGITYTQWGRL